MTVLTTPVRGGMFILCTHTTEKHHVLSMPHSLFSREQAVYVAKLATILIGAHEKGEVPAE